MTGIYLVKTEGVLLMFEVREFFRPSGREDEEPRTGVVLPCALCGRPIGRLERDQSEQGSDNWLGICEGSHVNHLWVSVTQ